MIFQEYITSIACLPVFIISKFYTCVCLSFTLMCLLYFAQGLLHTFVLSQIRNCLLYDASHFFLGTSFNYRFTK